MSRRLLLPSARLMAGGRVVLPATTPPPTAKSLNLKITGLKTFVVSIGDANWIFAKVCTNQWLTGLGEGSLTSQDAMVASDGKIDGAIY
jgi:hypothetical protein